MALPSQVERSTQMSRPVMGRTSGRRGPTSLPVPYLAGIAVVLLGAGGWGLWYVTSGDKAASTVPAASTTAGAMTPGAQLPAAASPTKTDAPQAAPLQLRQGTGGSARPAATLGEAMGQTNGQPNQTPAVQPPPPSTTVPVVPASPQGTVPGKDGGTPGTPVKAPTPGNDPTKPSPVDVSRPDMKPGETTPAAGDKPAPPAAPSAGDVTATGSPQGVRSMIEAGDRALAGGKLVEARATYSKALLSPEAAKGDQEILRQKLTTINEDLVFSAKVTPGDDLTESYTVVSGDALEKIRKKRELTTEWALIQRVNKMSSPHSLKIGQKLKLVRGPFHAVVHKGEYRLDLFAGSPDDQGSWLYIRSFKVGIGENNGTPIGMFTIKSKMQNPDWRNPRTGEKFDRDDPKNPIGEYWLGWLGLGDSAPITGYGLHGTVEPDSIGQAKSMGCVRLNDEDIKLVYELLAMKISVVRVVP